MTSTISPWETEWLKDHEITRGGQGVIWEMISKTDPIKRAVLKEIVPRWANDPQARERLDQESETLTKLHTLGARVPQVIDTSARHNSSDRKKGMKNC